MTTTQQLKLIYTTCSRFDWVCQAGISCADRVVTVSPGYAWEIQTPDGGWGMEGMLTSRSYALNGVLNGVDLVEWDPDNDPHIYQNFNESNLAEGKKVNKAGLQKEMGLPERPEVHTPALPHKLVGLMSGSSYSRHSIPYLLIRSLICLIQSCDLVCLRHKVLLCLSLSWGNYVRANAVKIKPTCT